MRSFTLLLLFTISFISAKAQSTLTDGSINYSVSVDSDEPAAAILSLGTSLDVSFKGNKTKLEASVASNTVKIVADNSKPIGMAIMNILGEKKAVKIEQKHFEDAQRDVETLSNNPIKYLDSYKTIAGYECQKVLMKDLRSGANIIFYVTNKINPKNDKVAHLLCGEIKGFPLGVMIRKDGNTVTIMAKNVSATTPNDAAFAMSIPSGYKLTTIRELEALFKGKI